MKKLLLMAALFAAAGLYAQAPIIEWQKSLGGSSDDRVNSIQQTTDGGYIVAGYNYSNDGDISGNHGSHDYWIVKLNSSGGLQWQKSLGGTSVDEATSIQQTTDGGYIVAGLSSSQNGDVSGNHGTFDYWVVKLNSSGNIQWQKSLGGSDYEVASSIQQTTDGGYIVAGYSYSNDGDATGNHGATDAWIVKLNSIGGIQWQKSLGGSLDDKANSIQQTTDGGYIVAGASRSNNGDVSGHHGFIDYWVVKLNSLGNIQWQKSLGGSDWDEAHSVQQTSDGGYIVAGMSKSNDGDVTGNHGVTDFWVVKLNSSGNIQWQKTYGGSDTDRADSIIQTSDGGYVVAGNSYSNDGDVSGNHGVTDVWIVKLNSTGDILWQKTYGGSGVDWANSIQQTTDGGYIVGAYSNSNDGDVSVNHGWFDYWIVKLSPDPLPDPCDDKIIMECGTEYTATLVPNSGSWVNYTDVIYDYSGSEKVFEFTPAVSGNYKFNVVEGTDDADFFLMDGCSNSANNVTPSSSGYWNGFTSTEGNVYLDAGITYYLIADLYKYSNTTTVTVSVDCPAAPCTEPSMSASATDAGDNDIAGCIDADSDYFVKVVLSGGTGNASYTVTDGIVSQNMTPGVSKIFGPYPAGTNRSFTATGDDDSTCAATTEVDSPDICEVPVIMCNWKIRVWSNANGEGTSWYLKDGNGDIVLNSDDVFGTVPHTFDYVSAVVSAEGPVTFHLDATGPGYRSVNYNLFRDEVKIEAGTVRNDVLHLSSLQCEGGGDVGGDDENPCDWTVRVWSSSNGAGTSWSMTNTGGVVEGETNLPASFNNIVTFSAAGPLTFTLNADIPGEYRSVNYNVFRGGVKIHAGTVRNKVLEIDNLSCAEAAAKFDLGTSLDTFNFRYHPNPVKDILYINSVREIKSIRAFNLSGQLVLETIGESGTSNEIDMSGLPVGVYVFKAILENDNVETFKVIKK